MFSQKSALHFFGVRLFHGYLPHIDEREILDGGNRWLKGTYARVIKGRIYIGDLCIYALWSLVHMCPLTTYSPHRESLSHQYASLWHMLRGRRMDYIRGVFQIWGVFLYFLSDECLCSIFLRGQLHSHVSTTFLELRSPDIYCMVDGCIVIEVYFWFEVCSYMSYLRSFVVQYFSEFSSTVMFLRLFEN